MRILIVDDHASFCEGLIAALRATRSEYHADFNNDPEAAVESLASSTDYDLLIIDLMMPGMGGIEMIRRLSSNPTPIMVLSSVQDVVIIRQLFELGIVGFVPKSYSVHQIVAAIEVCRAGELYLPESLQQEINTSQDSTSALLELTPRQIEVLRCLDKGLSNHGIADALSVSEATIKSHINNLFKTLEVHNRVSCLREARRLGLLTGTSPSESD